ncbi:MAG: ABC transporter permease [Dysgonamonadaceae bacterium]|jgi:ABC-2 type transport system permease protein|nr:ABC transporter permease [Dysgonamonadaceae bacterium]
MKSIIIQREYLTRIKKKSFIFLTIFIPFLFAGLSAGIFFLESISAEKTETIVVVDATGEYFPVLERAGGCRFIKAQTGFEEFRKHSSEPVYATLVISADLLTNPDAIALYSSKPVAGSVKNAITSALNDYLSDKKLASYNIPNLRQIIDGSKIKLNLKSVGWDGETGNETQAPETSALIGMGLSFLIYMFIMIYGGMVMQGVMEEKSSRIVEIIISSAKPFDLMMGKLVGIGLVGITQFGIWALLLLGVQQNGALLLAGNPAVFQFSHTLNAINIAELSLFFILFFIGGYLLYASLFAAVGAIVDSPEDAQQYIMPLTILIVVAFSIGISCAQSPDGQLAFWTSFFPFTSPVVMMVRIPYGVSWWELLLSVALLFACVIFIIKVVAKIYRTGILMYGKKLAFKKIFKN